MQRYYEKALLLLKEIPVLEEKKRELETFAENLLYREN